MTEDTEPSPLSEALAQVQEELTRSKEQRVEERFVWTIVVLVLLDVLILQNTKNPTLPLVVLVLELVGLTVVARRMGIASAAVVLDRLTAAIAHKETS